MLVLHFKLYIIYFEQYKNKKVNLGVIWPYLKSRNKETLTAKSHSEYKWVSLAAFQPLPQKLVPT